MSVQPLLTARGLVKRYGRVIALNNADFDLYPGEILAVIGDNGAGKSSLIKAISGAVVPDDPMSVVFGDTKCRSGSDRTAPGKRLERLS